MCLINSVVSSQHGYGGTASRGVPVYVPVFSGTHRTYPRRDGQAELSRPMLYRNGDTDRLSTKQGVVVEPRFFGH